MYYNINEYILIIDRWKVGMLFLKIFNILKEYYILYIRILVYVSGILIY